MWILYHRCLLFSDHLLNLISLSSQKLDFSETSDHSLFTPSLIFATPENLDFLQSITFHSMGFTDLVAPNSLKKFALSIFCQNSEEKSFNNLIR